MSNPELVKEAANLFLLAFGDQPGARLAHAKGIVCEGEFTATPAAAELSRAAHFKGTPVGVVVRFSNGTGLPLIPDGDPNGNPKGIAIRFQIPGGGSTDILANGLNGFPAGTPEDFVAFLGGAIKSPPGTPSPTPLEKFLSTHPLTVAYLSQPNLCPTSFATQKYFANDAFIFVNAQGKKQATRYQFIPLAGEHHLEPAAAAAQPPNFLMDDLKARLALAPIEFKLVVQLAEPTDPTSDATKVWPDSRKLVELGLIKIKRVDPNSAETEKSLFMDPVHLTDGIELSDDPLPPFRSQVYSISIEHRTRKR